MAEDDKRPDYNKGNINYKNEISSSLGTNVSYGERSTVKKDFSSYQDNSSSPDYNNYDSPQNSPYSNYSYGSPYDYSQPRSRLSDAETKLTENDLNSNGYEQEYSPISQTSASSTSSQYRQNSSEPASDNSGNSTSSIRQQESDTSRQVSGFDKSSNNRPTNKSNNNRAVNKFKKKIATSAIAFICSLAGMFGVSTLISGPMQLVQAASVIKDFTQDIVDMQQSVRSMVTSASDISSFAKDTAKGAAAFGDEISDNRIGKFSKALSNRQMERLSDNGITFSHSSPGKLDSFDLANGESIGLAGEYGADDVASALGISADKIDIADDGAIKIAGDLSYSDAKKVVSSLDDSGKFKVVSWLETRATLKREGYISWLHPIQKAKKAVQTKLSGLINDMVSKISPGSEDDVNNRIDDNSETDADRYNEGQDDDRKKVSSSDGDEIHEEGKNFKDDIPDDRGELSSEATEEFSSDILDKLKGAKKIANVVAMIVTFVCAFKDIWNKSGAWKMKNIVHVAEKGSSLISGFGSQVKSGNDISMEQAGKAAQMVIGDDVKVLKKDGKQDGDKTTYSDIWSAAPFCKEVNGFNCNKTEKSAPAELQNVTSKEITALPDSFNDVLGSIFSGLDPFLDTICLVNNTIQSIDPVGKIFEIITKPIISKINKTKVMISLMKFISRILNGDPLNLAKQTPEGWGYIGMYGGKYASNDKALTIGGKRLSSQESLELRLEQRRYLAWKNSRKPLLARLADPSDYNSSINQIARAANLHTGPQDMITQLANAFRIATAAPTIIAVANGQVYGNSAYAASSYDYGVPDYGWSLDEMNDITDTKNSDYSMVNNTAKAVNLLKTDYDEYHKYARYCLSTEISDKDSSFDVAPINSSEDDENRMWNYADATEDKRKCREKENNGNYRIIRLYVMDQMNAMGSMCYDGDESDPSTEEACQNVAVDTSGDSETSSDSSDDGAASTGEGDATAKEYLEKFKSKGETEQLSKYHYRYGNYSTSSNGCTTVSAWFIGKHTNLTYGHGDGREVVDGLKRENSSLDVVVGKTPKAPSIFSAYHAMGTSSGWGHTGLVTSVDSDGTIYTLEAAKSWKSLGHGGPITKSHKKSEYYGKNGTNSYVKFVYVGDHLKDSK